MLKLIRIDGSNTYLPAAEYKPGAQNYDGFEKGHIAYYDCGYLFNVYDNQEEYSTYYILEDHAEGSPEPVKCFKITEDMLFEAPILTNYQNAEYGVGRRYDMGEHGYVSSGSGGIFYTEDVTDAKTRKRLVGRILKHKL